MKYDYTYGLWIFRGERVNLKSFWYKEEPEHSLSTYIQYYFYPCTITGPWITLSKFAEAKNADDWSKSIPISGFLSRILKWALALAAGEMFHHLFYLNCIAIDIQMIKKMQYFNLVAFVVCTIYKTMIELYICYAFNYAVCAIDGIYFEVRTLSQDLSWPRVTKQIYSHLSVAGMLLGSNISGATTILVNIKS